MTYIFQRHRPRHKQIASSHSTTSTSLWMSCDIYDIVTILHFQNCTTVYSDHYVILSPLYSNVTAFYDIFTNPWHCHNSDFCHKIPQQCHQCDIISAFIGTVTILYTTLSPVEDIPFVFKSRCDVAGLWKKELAGRLETFETIEPSLLSSLTISYRDLTHQLLQLAFEQQTIKLQTNVPQKAHSCDWMLFK